MHERFVAKIRFTDTCWLWQGAKTNTGYGRIWDGERMVMAHRYAYEFCVGPIPQGLTIDHLCRVRSCVNPSHLEPVTMRDNLYRSPIYNGNRTHCRWGHEFTMENCYAKGLAKGVRRCKKCSREQALRWQRASRGG